MVRAVPCKIIPSQCTNVIKGGEHSIVQRNQLLMYLYNQTVAVMI